MTTLEALWMITDNEIEFFVVAKMFGYETEEIAIFLEITY